MLQKTTSKSVSNMRFQKDSILLNHPVGQKVSKIYQITKDDGWMINGFELVFPRESAAGCWKLQTRSGKQIKFASYLLIMTLLLCYYLFFREGFKKKMRQKCGLLPNQGGEGSPRVIETKTCFTLGL